MGLRLRSLSLRAFRAFRDENSLSFPEKGLVLVRGWNEDDKTASGAGKSSLFLALAEAFGYSPFPATTHQSWHTKSKWRVQVDLDVNGTLVSLTRGDKPSLITEQDTITGAKGLNEELRKIVGVSVDLLKALCYRAQGERGMFMSLTDEGKKDFLSQLLNLEHLESIAEEARKAGNGLQQEVERNQLLRQQLVDLLAQIDLTPPTLEEDLHHQIEAMKFEHIKAKRVVQGWDGLIGSASLYIADRAIELSEQRHHARAFLEAGLPKDESKTLQENIENVRRQLKVAIGREDQRVKAIERQMSDLRAKIMRAISEREKVSTLDEQIKELEVQLAAAESEVCFNCEREWRSPLNEKRITEFKHSIAVKKQKALYVRETTAFEEASLNAQVKTLDVQRNVLDPEIERLRKLETEQTEAWSKMASSVSANLQAQQKFDQEWDARKVEAIEPLQARFRILEQKKMEAENTAVDIFNKMDELNRRQTLLSFQNSTLQNQYVERKAQAERLQQQIDANLLKTAELEIAMQAELDFAAMVGREGFLGSIFDEVLAEISAETNKLLRNLRNTSSTTIYFKSEYETQRGTTKKKIVPMIMKDGEEIPFKSGLSGGQQTSAELAVDLAVGVVIGRRTGLVPGWLVIDEAFNGHDVPIMEDELAVLRAASEDRLILVVDHATETKEMFDMVIDVETVNKVATIRK